MEAHDYQINQATREKAAAIWRMLNLPGKRVYDENLINANECACTYLDSFQKIAWDYHLEGFSPEDIARIVNLPIDEVDYVISVTAARIRAKL